MQNLSMGILAHVDAGKTTLTEAMLYASGVVRKLGRVDHGNAFLDTDELERKRGITILSKQAIMPLGDKRITILDTPGHVDFSTEMERTLQVMDYAILVISGTDGVQSHARTLWNLLARHQIPTLLFINKMDLPGPGREALMASLQQLDARCVDFSQPADARNDALALCSDEVLNEYLETGSIDDAAIAELLARRAVFPCFFGSALHLDGVDELLSALQAFLRQREYPRIFGARVFKISRDAQGARLTHLKITGGKLMVKTMLSGMKDGEQWNEKADQLRLYSGQKFELATELEAGAICAVTGLTNTWPGQGLGIEPGGEPPQLEPVLNYRVILPEGTDATIALRQLRELEDEDPMLRITWVEQTGEIHVQLMGEVQLQVLRERIRDRFDMPVEFDTGHIVYRETILDTVEGVGHFEPLRHYAEVHLLLEPLERGSGLVFDTRVSEDILDRNWQRLIQTHLVEKEHLGVLVGAPITDMRISLAAGRAHLKHTEGGDFRQATYRAVRQGLMKAKSLLLEPMYRFTLEVPTPNMGRAMTDLQRMCAEVEAPQTEGEMTILTGTVPVQSLQGYALELASYTRGLGRLSCISAGYAPCHNQEEVVAAARYDAARDLENTPDSVFCAHGAGFIVPWDQVKDYMHLPSCMEAPKKVTAPQQASVARRPAAGFPDDRELEAIFERTYGAVQRKDWLYAQSTRRYERLDRHIATASPSEEFLLVDGYNILFAWDDLKELAERDIDAAREALMNILANYQAYKKCTLILVFDAYKVKNNLGTVSRFDEIYVVYTKQAETADQYIEKTTYRLSNRRHVRVATSDGIEQLIILGHGAERISARLFQDEVHAVLGQIKGVIQDLARRDRPTRLEENEALQQRLEELRAKEE